MMMSSRDFWTDETVASPEEDETVASTEEDEPVASLEGDAPPDPTTAPSSDELGTVTAPVPPGPWNDGPDFVGPNPFDGSGESVLSERSEAAEQLLGPTASPEPDPQTDDTGRPAADWSPVDQVAVRKLGGFNFLSVTQWSLLPTDERVRLIRKELVTFLFEGEPVATRQALVYFKTLNSDDHA